MKAQPVAIPTEICRIEVATAVENFNKFHSSQKQLTGRLEGPSSDKMVTPKTNLIHNKCNAKLAEQSCKALAYSLCI
jgi:hypothetical protein